MREGFLVERVELICDPHLTAGFALALVLRGELRARLPLGASTQLAAGDVLVVGPREEGLIARRRGRGEVLVFRAQGEWLVRALEIASFELEPAEPRAATLRAGTAAASRAAICIRDLAGAPGRNAEATLARAARALDLLAIGFAAIPEELAHAARRSSPRSEAFDAALERLGQGPLEDLSLSRFAAGLGFSERQVSRLVRERLGCSFGAHVAALRLSRAQRLLAESDLPVIEVAAEAGFGSLGHFNQRFRTSTGRTPSAFRAAERARLERRPSAGIQAPGVVGPVLPASVRAVGVPEARSSCFTMARSHAAKGASPS
jgi:AraC-like DNA-binding protein